MARRAPPAAGQGQPQPSAATSGAVNQTKKKKKNLFFLYMFFIFLFVCVWQVWLPAAIDASKEYCVAQVNFTSAEVSHLNCAAKDMIVVLEKYPTGWWRGQVPEKNTHKKRKKNKTERIAKQNQKKRRKKRKKKLILKSKHKPGG